MRAFDTIVSLIGLLLLSPLLLAIAVLIKLDSEGPVFHRGQRVGKDGRLFQLYKFRTMVEDAEKMGPGITAAGDPRITRFGRALRRYKIDELPQLINVLKGEMSLVGPRPEDPRYVERYSRDQRTVLNAKPGITSAASLAYRFEESLLAGNDWEKTYQEEILPQKLSIELEYLKNRSIMRDFAIVGKTIVAVFRRREMGPPWPEGIRRQHKNPPTGGGS